jgi:hypothetical protein
VNRGVSAAVHAALETALETALPAEAEAMRYPLSVIEEAPSASVAPSVPPEPLDVYLPRRRPTASPWVAPSPAAPRDDRSGPAEPVEPAAEADPAPRPHQAPDLAVLDQVLRSLQRMA